MNSVDFEKAFDNIHRDSLWRILRVYGIPLRIVQIIKSFYHNFTCSVGSSSLNFQVKTGVRQGCVTSAVLFNLVIDCVMRRIIEDQPRGIRWTLFDTLEELDFADDLALLSHTHQQLVSWCFEPSQPQRITSGLTNINTCKRRHAGSAGLVNR